MEVMKTPLQITIFCLFSYLFRIYFQLTSSSQKQLASELTGTVQKLCYLLAQMFVPQIQQA